MGHDFDLNLGGRLHQLAIELNGSRILPTRHQVLEAIAVHLLHLVEGSVEQLDQFGQIQHVWLSALQSHGLDLLVKALLQHFSHKTSRIWLHLPPKAGKLRSELYSSGAVIQEFVDDEGCWEIEAKVPYQKPKKFEEYQLLEEPEWHASL